MQNELISVIIPIYNIENYISKCIESVINQTYTELEIILVNDGSTDECIKICNEYAELDSRIILINKENGGLSDARNNGIEMASGKYIGFIDGDDWIEPNMYELLYRGLINAGADIAFGNIRRTSMREEPNNEVTDIVLLEGEQIMSAYISSEYKPHIRKSVCDKLYQKEAIGSVRFVVGQFGEDGPFNTQVLSHIKKCVYVPQSIYNYRDIRPGSISYNNIISDRLFSDRIPIMRDQIDILSSMGRKDLAQRQLKYYYINLLDYYFLCIEKKQYLKKIETIIYNEPKLIKTLIFSRNMDNKIKFKLLIFVISPKLFLRINKIVKQHKNIKQ